MIIKIRSSLFAKCTSIMMIWIMFFTLIIPFRSFGLTGGPAQPEFNAFTPIGTSDMVDLTSGDLNYNIPLMDIGGFPINMSYKSGVSTDQEASWIGLGWDLSIGQINRQMRGLPDDFSGNYEESGDKMVYENSIKSNYTIGGSTGLRPALFGFETDLLSVDVSAQYNSFSGMSISPSIGVSYKLGSISSIGLNVTSSPDGLTISSNLSLNGQLKNKHNAENTVGTNIGLSFNSRQGLSSINMSASRNSVANNRFNSHKRKVNSSNSVGSSISFVDNHYTPMIQNKLTTRSFTFNAAIDVEFFGVEAGTQIRAFGSNQFIDKKDKRQVVRAFGYENNHLAQEEDVRDFNREKDGNFCVNSTNAPLTNYTYDIYSVQGQGVSGMFRPYRSQVGYVSDNLIETNSVDVGLGGEFGGGNLFRLGSDVEITNTDAQSGVWKNRNNAISNFESIPSNKAEYEEVYFKNVGDLAADNDINYNIESISDKLGAYQPLRMKIGTVKFKREIEPKYEIKHKTTPNGFEPEESFDGISFKRKNRVKRNQNIQQIKNNEISNNDGNLIGFKSNTYAKGHHTAGFIITRNDGARYIYGDAVYNNKKEEVTFAVGKSIGNILNVGDPGSIGDCNTGLVEYDHGVDNTTKNSKGDRYYNRVSTPAYAHTFLLTTLLSADYSDIDNNGPSDKDLGSYTSFSYVTKNDEYNWRVPVGEGLANFNQGLRTDPTDDKGSYVSGKKEIKYLEKIETKTHVAIFHISSRADGIGASELGRLDKDGATSVDRSLMYKIDSIALYSKGEYDGLGLDSESIPIKVVHFVYDYSLCLGIPNFDSSQDDSGLEIVTAKQGGKLTLKKVYFTYRNSRMGKYNPYIFTYGDINHDGTVSTDESELRNPNYNLKAYDIWGCYKPNLGKCDVLDHITAPEFNYVEQNDQKTDDYVAAWGITDIKLPSGGIIQLDYESDDYTHVQNKNAMRMFKVVGAGQSDDGSGLISDPFTGNFNPLDLSPASGNSNSKLIQSVNEALLYDNNSSITPYKYLYLKLDDQDDGITNTEFYEKYISQIINSDDRLMYFRFFTNITKSGGKDNTDGDGEPFEYITGYAKISDVVGDYKVFIHNTVKYGVIPLEPVELESGLFTTADSPVNANPISKAAWNFGRKYLSKYVYEMEDPKYTFPAGLLLNTVFQAISNLKETISGPNRLLRSKGIGRRFIPEKSWVRLSNPTTKKKGGGARISRIVMTDEWAKMNEPLGTSIPANDIRNQKYGQEYDYTLENGYSSGVATYEPVGSKENPLVQPSYVHENRLLAPDEENYIEKPFGESFFPNPTITYARVTVKNIERRDDINNTPQNLDDDRLVKKHATGKVVTEHFTSKDYPVILDQTPPDIHEDGPGVLSGLLNLNIRKHLTMTQGYVIHLNDMNGKMKNQRIYGEKQTTAISGVDYLYDDYTSTDIGEDYNKGRLNNYLPTLTQNGNVINQNVGVEYDVINDFREMKTVTEVAGINTNLAGLLGLVAPITIPLPLPDYSRHEDKLNLVTTTKVINTFGIQKEVIAYDAGASVRTKNLLWDNHTGEVLLTETVNEYDEKFYSFNYPAYWKYSGMDMASINSGASVEFTPSVNNDISITDQPLLHLGDFGIITETDPDGQMGNIGFAWINEIGSTYFKMIDDDGNVINLVSQGVDYSYHFKIIRSGRRNLQATSMGSLVFMRDLFNYPDPNPNPDPNPDPNDNSFVTNMLKFLKFVDEDYDVINAGAVEFKSQWDLQCECGIVDGASYNPYLYNQEGVWRANKSHLYLTGRNQTKIGSKTDPSPRNDGFYTSYSPFYYLNSSLIWSIDATNWKSTSEVTKYSQFGVEIENKDALDRYSSAQYGYNFMFPMAVGANSKYSQLGFDGFEDYFGFDGCQIKEHFGFRDNLSSPEVTISGEEAHTGKYSIKLLTGEKVLKILNLNCP